MPEIFIGIPHGGMVAAQMLKVLWAMAGEPHGYTLDLQVRSGHMAATARNLLADDFLKTDATHLLFIDADNPPLRNPLELIRENLDIVGLPTPIQRMELMTRDLFPFIWNVYDADEKGHKTVFRESGIHEVDVIGSGCVLLKRKVVEALRPLFLWKQETRKSKPVGDDFYFCQRAQRHGFKVHASWDHICSHVKQVDLLNVIHVMQKEVARLEKCPPPSS